MLPRTALSRANARAFRQIGRPGRTGYRFQSTNAGASSSAYASHAVAGVAGGAVVVLTGYVWYRSSGIKTAVDVSTQVKKSLEATRDKVVDAAKSSAKNPSEALQYLRRVAQSYTGLLPIPGAKKYVDETFDTFDELHEKHGEEMDGIVSESVENLQKTIKDGRADMDTARKVYEIVGETVQKLQSVGVKMGSDLLDKSPKFKEAVGSAYDELKGLAERGSPEAKQILEDTTSQLKDMISSGKPTEEMIENARKLLKENVSKIQQVVGSSGAVAVASNFFENGWENFQAMAKTVPGGEEVLKKAPHVQALLTAVKERGDDAKQLAQETWQDVVRVLEEKGKKAEKLGKEVKDEAQNAEGDEGDKSQGQDENKSKGKSEQSKGEKGKKQK